MIHNILQKKTIKSFLYIFNNIVVQKKKKMNSPLIIIY